MGKWRGRIEVSTFKVYFSWLHRFCHSIGRSPDELIEWARKVPDKYVVLDALQDWVNGCAARYNTKRIAYATVRSFFMHNRVELPLDKHFRIRADEEPVDRKLRREHVQRFIGLATEPWRSVLLVKWHALLDNQGLVYVSNNHAETVVKALRENADICRFTMPGRKKMKNIQTFETFIGSEPLTALREYFDNERGWPKPGEPIWIYSAANHRGRPMKVHALQEAWMHLVRRAKIGVPKQPAKELKARYGFNMHNTRDLVISHLTEVPNLKEVSVEYWAGHQIDPLGYRDLRLKPQFLEEQYRLAIPYLNIITQAPDRKHEITGGELVQAIQDHPEIIEQLAIMIKERSIR